MWSAVEMLPSVAVLDGDGLWLTSTLVSLLVVLTLGGLAAVYLYAARHFRWVTQAEEIRLTRKFRVAFGALFLAATLLPYLLAKAPLLAVTSMSLAVIALIPILVTRPDYEASPPEDTLEPKS